MGQLARSRIPREGADTVFTQRGNIDVQPIRTHHNIVGAIQGRIGKAGHGIVNHGHKRELAGRGGPTEGDNRVQGPAGNIHEPAVRALGDGGWPKQTGHAIDPLHGLTGLFHRGFKQRVNNGHQGGIVRNHRTNSVGQHQPEGLIGFRQIVGQNRDRNGLLQLAGRYFRGP